MNRKFSIVIPTMWRYEPFTKFLGDLLDHELVGEVIIINNDAANTPQLPVSDKLRMIDNGRNLKVNPSWNQGIRLCMNEDVAIINDDLVFDLRVFKKVLEINDDNFGLVCLCAGEEFYDQPKVTDGIINIIPWTGFSLFGFGQLMFINKNQHVNIPYQLEIYYGDDWILNNALTNKRSVYAITNMLHKTPYAVTSKEILRDIYHTDHQTLMDVEKVWMDRYQPFLYLDAEAARVLIDQEYERAKNIPSDINEHVETLYTYALACDHITELGVRTGVSTRAFLNTVAPYRSLISYDIVQDENVQALFYAASKLGHARYHNGDSRVIDIEPTDLLFIDTDHTYEQLSAELTKHASKVRKYIVMHDTMHHAVDLTPAVLEFLAEQNGVWLVDRHFKNNNGLTILKRNTQ